ncbi:MAG: NUDIX domain-containing protein, partial [Massilia sp.]
RCPLKDRCVAFATGRTAELPVRKPSKATPEKRAAMLVVVDAGQVLLEQRADSGIWGGLLSLPEVDGHVSIDIDLPDPLLSAQRFGAVDTIDTLLPLTHGFTHYKLHIHPRQVALSARAADVDGFVWWDLDKIEKAPLPAPVKKLLVQLSEPSLF